tara:strand:+ start:14028 stop:14666 length:639 start_codon:yes stop_codon:yes gene_type:complete
MEYFKTFDLFVNESYYNLIIEGIMSELHMMAKEAKNEAEFIKDFFKDYGDKIKKSKESVEWVKSLYNDTVKESRLHGKHADYKPRKKKSLSRKTKEKIARDARKKGNKRNKDDIESLELRTAAGMQEQYQNEFNVTEAELYLYEKLSKSQRSNLKDSEFVFPEKRSWPIHTSKQAKIALVFATWPQHEKVKDIVVKTVLKKYPELKGVGASK